MNLKRIAATATMTGALGAAALGLGASPAQADPDWDPWWPWDPEIPEIWEPGDFVRIPPGHVKKWCPWNSPPGHWLGSPHGIPCT
jgi:hypothetical protein